MQHSTVEISHQPPKDLAERMARGRQRFAELSAMDDDELASRLHALRHARPPSPGWREQQVVAALLQRRQRSEGAAA